MTPSSATASRRTTLGELAKALGAIAVNGDPSVVVTGVRQDSRRVETGELFAVRGGARTSGWNYVTDAIGRGAAAIMVLCLLWSYSDNGTPDSDVALANYEVQNEVQNELLQ